MSDEELKQKLLEDGSDEEMVDEIIEEFNNAVTNCWGTLSDQTAERALQKTIKKFKAREK